MKFRAKPVEINAVQFTDELKPPMGIYKVYVDGIFSSYRVNTAGGPATVHLGDWIVKESEGSGYYPVRPEIFEKRWEKIDD